MVQTARRTPSGGVVAVHRPGCRLPCCGAEANWSSLKTLEFPVQRTRVSAEVRTDRFETVGWSDDSCHWLPRASVPLECRTASGSTPVRTDAWLTRAHGDRAKELREEMWLNVVVVLDPLVTVARSGSGAPGGLSSRLSVWSVLFPPLCVFLFGRRPKDRHLQVSLTCNNLVRVHLGLSLRHFMYDGLAFLLRRALGSDLHREIVIRCIWASSCQVIRFTQSSTHRRTSEYLQGAFSPLFIMNEPDLKMHGVMVYCLLNNSFISASGGILDAVREMIM